MMVRILLGFIVAAAALVAMPAQAGCTYASANQPASFGSQNSFTIAGTPQIVQTNSGISCTATGVLTVAGTNSVTGVISSQNGTSSSPLMRSAGGYTVPYQFCKDQGCSVTYPASGNIQWVTNRLLDLLGLFSGAGGTLPLYARTTPGANVPAGVYNDVATINWNYSFCLLGIGSLCAYETGSGTTRIAVSLTVTNFCYLDSAPNVSFTPAALISSFTSLNSALGVRCTLLSSYTINLSGANPLSGSWRQMMATVGGTPTYLQYQFYQGNGTAWTPTSNYAGIGTGLSQNIPYTATINPAQANKQAGDYSEVVTVTVTY